MSILANQRTHPDTALQEKLDYSRKDSDLYCNSNRPSFKKLTLNLKKFSSLVELNLEWCRLKSLPEVSLDRLRTLNISSNFFRTIPDVVFKWTSLEVIVASQNRMDSLPNRFSELASLRVLDLGATTINELPPSLQNHEKLEVLDLGENGLVLTIDSFNLANPLLKKVEFFDNDLSEVPSCIWNLKNIERLSFCCNKITTIVGLEKVKTLRSLDINENPIAEFKEITKLTQLHCLKVALRTEEEQDFDFSCLSQLRTLKIDGEINKSRVSADISDLEVLRCRFTGLKEMPKISTAKKLKKLDLRGNKISYIANGFVQFTLLQELNFRFNKLSSFPESAKFDNLIMADFSYNEFEEVPSFIFSCKNLEKLNLDRNTIQSIPDLISTLEKLKVFRMAGNRVSEVSENLFKLVNLEELTIAGNRIEFLPDKFEVFKTMKKLSLSNNKLTEFPASIVNMKMLHETDFSGNPFKVEPDLSRFKERKIKVSQVGRSVLM
ncbi:MAG: hypothetical protein VX777_05495 [Chlamydiota bacterium]|nr:hypothetical protein [Chlamydiota bacterium]